LQRESVCDGFLGFIDCANGGSLRGMIAGADAMLARAFARLLKLKSEGLSVEDAIVNAPLDDLEAK